MTNRRDFLTTTGAVALGAAMPALALAHNKLEVHSRLIPGTAETLPMVGLGNSRLFQEGNLEATRDLLELFIKYGGSYIDTLGPSRFTVASVMQAHSLQSELFVGTYLGTVQYEAMAEELEKVRDAQGKDHCAVLSVRNATMTVRPPIGKQRKYRHQELQPTFPI